MPACFFRYILFVITGVITVSIGETQYSVFIRGDVENLIGSIVFNSVYLSFSFALIQAIRWIITSKRISLYVITLLFGTFGLMIEWFLIGNSPWGNPDASQSAMFAFWACMVVVPIVLLEDDSRLIKTKKRIMWAGGIYTLTVVLGHLLLPSGMLHFAFHIWTVVIGYIAMLVYCVYSYTFALKPKAI